MVSAKRIKIVFSSSPSLTAAAEIVANNNDLLTEILLHLPIKSLMKFKRVSKHWLSLISSPQFTRLLKLSDLPCALFVRRYRNPVYDFIKLDPNYSNDAPLETLNFFNDPLGVDIIQSCNGLLLCSSTRWASPEAKHYVFNPTTKQYITLPPQSEVDEGYCGLYLAFDPSKSDNYKVINVRRCIFSEPDFKIEIYSSETGLWRISAASFTLDNMDIGFYGGVFWNGSLHWYTDSGPSFCFNVDREQIKEMPMSPIPDDWHRRRVRYFGESGGHLNLIEIYRCAATQLDVRELEKDYSGWFVKYRIDLEGVISAFPEMIKTFGDPTWLNYYAYEMWSIIREERDEDSYMVLHIPAKVIRYNLKDKSFKKLCDFTPGTSGTSYKQEDAKNFNYCSAYEYIESLARV